MSNYSTHFLKPPSISRNLTAGGTNFQEQKFWRNPAIDPLKNVSPLHHRVEDTFYEQGNKNSTAAAKLYQTRTGQSLICCMAGHNSRSIHVPWTPPVYKGCGDLQKPVCPYQSEPTTWEVAGDVQTPPHWSGTLDLESDKPRGKLHYIPECQTSGSRSSEPAGPITLHFTLLYITRQLVLMV